MNHFLFILACVAVPILWGIAVNWLFRRLQRSSSSTKGGQSRVEPQSESQVEQDEPVIEYYI